MAFTQKKILEYLKENKSIVLATSGDEDQPDLRTLGGYNFDGYTLYFGTAANSSKVSQINENNRVTILVQHEGQTIPDYQNITIYGEAEQLSGDEYELGKRKIQERRPNAEFNENIKNIYKVIAKKIKILDFSEKPENQVTIIEL